MASNNDEENAITPDSFDAMAVVRIGSSELEIFKKKAQRITGKSYSHVLREMIIAFNDGRLTITLTNEQQRDLGELYVTRK